MRCQRKATIKWLKIQKKMCRTWNAITLVNGIHWMLPFMFKKMAGLWRLYTHKDIHKVFPKDHIRNWWYRLLSGRKNGWQQMEREFFTGSSFVFLNHVNPLLISMWIFFFFWCAGMKPRVHVRQVLYHWATAQAISYIKKKSSYRVIREWVKSWKLKSGFTGINLCGL
jgi:hypothetical protein